MPILPPSGAISSLAFANTSLSHSILPPEIFHNLGQYSPWFPAANTNNNSSNTELPDGCVVTFVSQLERHGSRYPTNGAYRELRKTLRQIAKHLKRVPDSDPAPPSHHYAVKSRETSEDDDDREDDDGDALDPSLRWLREWVQTKKSEDGGMRNRLGNSELTPYGQYEAFMSGRRFSEQYAHLFDTADEVEVNYDFQSSSSKRSWLGNTSCQQTLPVGKLGHPTGSFWILDRVREYLCKAFVAPSADDVSIEPPRRRPFVRASGADRVVASSRFWMQGFALPRRPFHHASPESAPWPPKGMPSIVHAEKKGKKPHRPIRGLPYPDVVISEARKADKLGQGVSNNTLDVYTCSTFERTQRDNARSESSRRVNDFAKKATKEISKRLARQLGARKGGGKDRRGQRLHLEPRQVLQLFSLCAFDTVARLDPYGLILDDLSRNKDAVSPFCSLFQPHEFSTVYEISADIEKSFGFGPHQPLHKSLATPWLRELLARMQDRQPVVTPPTSINTTLDSNPKTFPLPGFNAEQGQEGPKAFVDFTHDNQLAPIIASLNLWNPDHHAWKTSKTTPFSGRITVEKIRCDAETRHDKEEEQQQQQEMVRILVNGDLASIDQGSWCPVSSTTETQTPVHQHLCPLSTFLSQLEWVDQPDEWEKCYQ